MRPFLLSYKTFLTVEKIDEKVSVAAELVVAGPGPAMSYSPNLKVSPEDRLGHLGYCETQFENHSLIGEM